MLSSIGGQLETLDVIDIRGFPVVASDHIKVLHYLRQCIELRCTTQVTFVNAHVVTEMLKNKESRDILLRSLNLNDGIGMEIAARLRGRRFPENLNGTDFLPRLLREAWIRGWRIFVYGSRQHALDAMLRHASEEYPGIQIAGANGFDPIASEVLLGKIRAMKADIVLVALGVPTQDAWLSRNLDKTGCAVGIGVGAFVDFYSGMVARAPRLVRRMRLEWLWRLAKEPLRLWRRYLVGGPIFLWWAMHKVRGG